MAEWTVQVNARYFKPGALSTGTAVASHTFKVSFDCSCCAEREGQGGELPGVDLERFSSSVTNASVTKRFESDFGADRVTEVATEIVVRAANCPEGRGVIVWILARGEFNTNENQPPFLWESYGAKGAWRICCCCDPFDCTTSYTVQNHRRPVGGGSGGLTISIVTQENSSCDGELQQKIYRLT